MRSKLISVLVVFALAGFVLSLTAWAQNNSKVVSAEPAATKAGDTITLHGEGLGKKSVVAVFLSSTDEDFAATIVEQTEDKIVVKLPKVKSGVYKASIQVGKVILIQPVPVTIEE